MKPPRNSANKRKQKAKEPLPTVDFIDLSGSPDASSDPFSSEDVYAVPGSPPKKLDAPKPKAPSHKSNHERLVTLSPLQFESSPTKLGGTLTKFLDENTVPSNASKPTQPAQTGQNQKKQGPNTGKTRLGTGVHDDVQTRARGVYRGPSMRRDSGITVETPAAIRKEKDRIKNGTRPYFPSITYNPGPLEMFSSNDFDPRRPPKNPYELVARPERRGDVPPLNLGRATRAEKSLTTTTSANNHSNNSHNAGPSRAQPSGPTERSQPAQRPTVENVSANAAVANPSAPEEAPTAPEITRRTFNVDIKVKTLQACLSSKEEYLAMSLAPLFDQEPFWSSIHLKVDADLVARGKFRGWKDVKDSVEVWCHPRRTNLREGNLPALSQSQPELDALVDAWNKVFVQRFCAIHRGYFEISAWALAKDKITEMVKAEFERWISTNLKSRSDGPESSARPPLLTENSSLADYNNAINSLARRSETSTRGTTRVQESEAVMSLVMELQPGLESVIAQELRDKSQNTARTERNEAQGSTGARQNLTWGPPRRDITYPEGSFYRERVNVTIPPTPTRPSAEAPRAIAQPHTEGHDSRRLKPPEATRLTQSSPVPGREDGPSKKRKSLDPFHSSPATPSNLAISTRGEELGQQGAVLSTPLAAQSKRQRVVSIKGSSDVPPSGEFTLEHRKTPGLHSCPQESSPAVPGYGNICGRNETSLDNVNSIPIGPRDSGRPTPPPWARDVPSRQRSNNTSWHSSRASHNTQYQDNWHSTYHGRHEQTSTRFRESTAEFVGMTPTSQFLSLRRDIDELGKKMQGREN
ncbi:hypothetical protein F66182_7566 [Fusarium sp. NRRL 66182]|nr:hypothetical protein F66182_7566 [Fusarium sp. NRRL 66182]